ncbi:uncharacterized protein K452DRAFT_231176 [Aplosporella prunicola CBS 121167]|uniref:Arrestin-like N-terminal domain-containing protein n=1 Tax=Aplosporella prunicola CBS 121167 TaxID=1176127 RepID=A0A6A6B8W5_9PEZI|nr:uncharacterized protein K452DRAFT_231176 [Aplosporella prunicola CBS 121167]KAF2140008.1 hypothetical protein K452DRAFT_231176 [Aplosporella prunicola CBS 121167]
MQLQVVLNQPPGSHYTNLDTITGRVLLQLASNTTVSSITVKLEGESRTRLVAPAKPEYGNSRPKPVLELHKILYKTLVVFPPSQLQDADWQSHNYTLNPGNYEYPFQFKLPFNNACHANKSRASNIPFTSNLGFAGFPLDVATPPTRHVKQTLPPSLTGFPGEAEVRYYVKCTVNRPSLLKENPRAFSHFNFLPIEPPRPPKADGEAYARRQHQFNPHWVPPSERRTSFFGKLGKDRPQSMDDSARVEPPRFSIDARLPNPAILTLNDDVPLRLIVKQLNERTEPLYLQMLQIELVGYTAVRAHQVSRTESSSWLLASMSNMNIPVGAPSDVPGTETPINREYWSDRPLPNSVAPSFDTCNLSRYYELEVRVGLGYASYKQGQDQLIILPLRLPVKVFSGIAPPPELLQKMATGAFPRRKPVPGSAAPSPLATDFGHAGPSAPTTPLEGGTNPFPHAQPMPQGSYLPPQAAHGYEDAPPSYEDAVAVDIPPVDGPRRDYVPPPVPEDAPRFSHDEKR